MRSEQFPFEHEVFGNEGPEDLPPYARVGLRDLSEIKDYAILELTEIEAEWKRFAEQLKEYNREAAEIWEAKHGNV